MRFLPLAAAAAFLCLAASTLAVRTATAADGDLTLRKAKLTIKPVREGRRAADKVTLKGEFPLTAFAESFDPAIHDVEVTVGGVTVFALPAPEERDGVKQKDRFRWILEGAAAAGRRKGPVLRLDVGFGKLKLRAKGLDLSAVEAGGSEDVGVALRLGDETYTTFVDFDLRKRRWRYRWAPPAVTPPPPGGGGGPPPDGLVAYTFIEYGQLSGVRIEQNVVVRDAPAWSALWAQHKAGSPPAVDFARDMVIGVFLGDRPTAGYGLGINTITRAGTTHAVSYIEMITQGSCPIAQVVTQPYAIVRIPRGDGAVTFDKITGIAICHGGPKQ